LKSELLISGGMSFFKGVGILFSEEFELLKGLRFKFSGVFSLFWGQENFFSNGFFSIINSFFIEVGDYLFFLFVS
jgi:hypothetical protein